MIYNTRSQQSSAQFPHKKSSNPFLKLSRSSLPQLKLLIPFVLLSALILPLTIRSASTPTENRSIASQGNALGQGMQLFLSPTGTANTSCSSTQPCDTLQTVLTVPNLGNNPGDTIILLDGVYHGQQNIVNKHFVHPVTIRSATPYKSTLQNTGNVLTLRNAYNVRIKDLELKHVEPIPVCDTGSNSAYIIQLSDSSDPGGPFGAKRGPDNVYYDAEGKLYPNGTDYSGEIVIENNIIHDSFCEDHIKLQNGGNIKIIGNMFYNQATRYNAAGTTANSGTPEEFIDVNSVFNVDISKNIFFNQFARAAEPGAFIVVKDSGMGVPNGNTRFGLTNKHGEVVSPYPNSNTFAQNQSNTNPGSRFDTCNPAGANCDTVIGSNSIKIDKNIFFNFSNTSKEYPWLQFGAEDTLMYVLNHGLVENNLFVGNSSSITRAPFELEGVRGFVFRNNTITGNLPSKHYGFRIKSQSFQQRFPNTELQIVNNIWSDQTGSMGSEDSYLPMFSGVENSTITSQRQMQRNVYWNAGNVVPLVANYLLQYTEDTSPVLTDPGIPNPAQVLAPIWNGHTFNPVSSNSLSHTTILSVFTSLVQQFGTPTASVADFADTATASTVDILDRPRGTRPDIGAVEVLPDALPSPSPSPTPLPSNSPTPAGQLRFNFQPIDTEVPSGYIADVGQRFGKRNGVRYGWNYDIRSATRKRNTAESQLRNTLIHMQLQGNYRWDVAVPNGVYQVQIMAGDPDYTDSLNNFRIESTILIDDGYDNFDYYSETVAVTDGRLTVRTAPSAENAKLNYIVITPI